MRRVVFILAGLILASAYVWGQERTYRVRRGDTWETISEKHYGTKQEWRRIADANGMGDRDPRKLRAGTMLVIPPLGREAPPPTTGTPAPVVRPPAVSPPPERPPPAGPGEVGTPEPRPAVERAEEESIRRTVREVPEEGLGPPGVSLFHLLVGVVVILVLFVIQARCLGGAARSLGIEGAGRGRCAAAAAILDVFIFFGALFAGLIVSAINVSTEGPLAAVVAGVVLVVFLWAAFWIAARILRLGFGRTVFLVVVASVFFAVIGMLCWGALRAIAAIIGRVFQS